MLTFLFWNMGGEGRKVTSEEIALQANRERHLLEILRNLANIYQVDVVMLAECPVSPRIVHAELNRGNLRTMSNEFRESDTES
jgi:hypothetical protein